MKQYYIAILALLLGCTLIAQNTVKMSAVKGNNFGVAYTLPKTELFIKAKATKTTRKAGDFYEYAERYLNISNPIIKDEVIFTLTDIVAESRGIPNQENSYLVEFKSGSAVAFLTLTKDGLICAINSDAQFDPCAGKTITETASKAETSLPNPNSFLTEEILRAGSKSKQAELIAKQILTLRQTKNDILTGEADNMPPDGNAYKIVMENLDLQEKALTSLFIGTETTEEIISPEYVTNIDKESINRKVAFRFSSKLGFVRNDDMSGAPVYLSLENQNPQKEEVLLSPKDQKELEKKFSKGIIYNIPGKANLKIEFNNKAWINKPCDVVQFGTQDVLSPQEIDGRKQPVKVIFYPELGAIKQII